MPGVAPLCPHCSVALREVNARACSGYLIVLDQCPQCGGIWCDRWELFPLAADEAARLDPVDTKSLGASARKGGVATGRCPRCAIPLRRFRDPVLPADTRIERCRVCDGMWLNRGELARVKRRAAARARPRDDALERLAASYAASSKWTRVPDLDGALQQREEDIGDAAELRSTLWSTIPWVVLNTVLRLLLKV